MTVLTLTPKLQIQQPPPSRLSMKGVMWYKIVKWIEKSTFSALLKTFCKVLSVLIIAWIIFAPSFALGYLTAALRWNSYRIPLCIVAVALALNTGNLLRLLRARLRMGAQTLRRANQHTYNGIPVPELADFLKETGSFKREEAIKRLGLSQGQYAKIGSELEDKGILIRGESNARILRPISREHLVTQLRDKFPLVWDPDREIWIERDGQFNRWVLSHEFKRRKLDQEIERKERKVERLEQKLSEGSAFSRIMDMATQTDMAAN